MERELIIERTRAGLAAARAEGRIGGRRPKFSSEEWAQMGRLIKNGAKAGFNYLRCWNIYAVQKISCRYV